MFECSICLLLSFCDRSNQLIPVSFGRYDKIHHGSYRTMISPLFPSARNYWAQHISTAGCDRNIHFSWIKRYKEVKDQAAFRCMDTIVDPESRDSWKVKEWDNRYRLDIRFDGKCYSGFHTWNIQNADRTVHFKVHVQSPND